MYRKGLLILTLLFQKDIDDVIEPKETREKLIAALRAIIERVSKAKKETWQYAGLTPVLVIYISIRNCRFKQKDWVDNKKKNFNFFY
jgi:hypothetical protein